MSACLFITATDTGAGKTILTSLLAKFLCERGERVAALKPICSGGRDDACALHAALGGKLSLDEINPWHFRAPIAPALAARREGHPIKLAALVSYIRALQKQFAITLVEGAGGLLSPLGEGFDSRDLLVALRADPIIAAPNQLGVINRLLLTLEALPARARRRAKIVLISPQRRDAATGTNAALLGEFFPSARIFSLPWLGRNIAIGAAVKKTGVRRTLHALLPD